MNAIEMTNVINAGQSGKQPEVEISIMNLMLNGIDAIKEAEIEGHEANILGHLAITTTSADIQ